MKKEVAMELSHMMCFEQNAKFFTQATPFMVV